MATFAAIGLSSPNVMWFMTADVVYVTVFPQLVCVLHFPTTTNAYGSVVGFFVGCSAFLMCGIPALELPPLVRLPMYDEERGQMFPYRTLCMGVSFISIITSSWMSRFVAPPLLSFSAVSESAP